MLTSAHVKVPLLVVTLTFGFVMTNPSPHAEQAAAAETTAFFF